MSKAINSLRSENAEQKVIIEWCNLYKRKFPQLDMILHIPNEGKRSKRNGAELKRMGLSKGVPDLFLAYPNNKYHGLWIELKADATKRVSKEQKEWINKLNKYGYKATVCFGADAAIQEIKNYLME